ncbi:MAG: LPS export ABC transporter permease LptG [Roseivivax sp.]|nr:LPS export ABC transporter permease LptG [Roseivivax sp.]
MTLHWYTARRFLWTFLAVLFVFFAFIVLLDLVDQVRRFDITFGETLRLTLLNTPQGLYQILPLVMILAAIALFVSLARSSELVVMRSAGRSGLAIIQGPVAVALVVGVLSVAMLNPIVAATSKRYGELVEGYRSGGTSTLSLGSEGLWLRQGDGQSQTVIRAARSNPEATVLYDVSFIAYAPGSGPVQRIEAGSATLQRGEWVLNGAKSWPLGQGVNPEQNASTHDRMTVPSTLTQERIRDSFGTPSVVPIWDLPAYITQLEIAGFSARRHMVWLQMELARPLFLVAMVLVAAGFTMRHSRLGRTGVSVLLAVMLGFGLYYVRNFAQILGENGQVPALLAAWAPPVASVLLALGVILQREEG